VEEQVEQIVIQTLADQVILVVQEL
jgi:hypothetical protein